MSYLITCPYCAHDYFYDVDYDVSDCEIIVRQCPECEKIFECEVAFDISFISRETPCKNGEPHLWTPRIGGPKEYLENKYRCKYCNETTEMTEEEFNKLGLTPMEFNYDR